MPKKGSYKYSDITDKRKSSNKSLEPWAAIHFTARDLTCAISPGPSSQAMTSWTGTMFRSSAGHGCMGELVWGWGAVIGFSGYWVHQPERQSRYSNSENDGELRLGCQCRTRHRASSGDTDYGNRGGSLSGGHGRRHEAGARGAKRRPQLRLSVAST